MRHCKDWLNDAMMIPEKTTGEKKHHWQLIETVQSCSCSKKNRWFLDLPFEKMCSSTVIFQKCWHQNVCKKLEATPPRYPR